MKKNNYVKNNAILFVMLFSMSILASSTVYAATILTSNSDAIGISLVNQDPDPALAGNTVEVRLGIENSGAQTANNVKVELVSSYPFQIVTGDSLTQDIGTIGAYQGYQDTQSIKIIKYRLQIDKDAKAGVYELQIKIYSDGLVNSITKTVLVNVGGATNAEIIHIDKTVIVPGQQSSLKFKINNVGSAPLKDITFSWKNIDGVILPVGSDNTRYVKYLDIGDSVDIEYQVIADTTIAAGLYPLELHLTYDSSDTASKTISTTAGVYIGGGTDFDIAFSDSTTGTTSFTIANIGSNPATSVSVSIPPQRAWRTTGSNSMIIGNLNKGDYTVASFKLQSQTGLGNRTGGRNGTYSGNISPVSGNFVNSGDLIIQIAYTDTMGIRTMVNKTINIGTQVSSNQTLSGYYGSRATTSKSTTFPSYVWYVVGAVILIAGFVLYRKYKKQKLLDSDARIKDVFKTKKK